jgi:hypothetical protein
MNALLGSQLLAHHVGVAAMPDEPLAQPVVEAVERLGSRRRLERHHAARECAYLAALAL